jgi:hypothetical protein
MRYASREFAVYVLLPLLWASPDGIAEVKQEANASEPPKAHLPPPVKEAFVAAKSRWYVADGAGQWDLTLSWEFEIIWTEDVVAVFTYVSDKPSFALYSKKANQTVYGDLDKDLKRVTDSRQPPDKGFPDSDGGNWYRFLRGKAYADWERELKKFAAALKDADPKTRWVLDFHRVSTEIPDKYRKLDYSRLRQDALDAYERGVRMAVPK